jgi:hypothetical protein
MNLQTFVTLDEYVQEVTDKTLKDLKKVYEESIKPLENIYKYKELSNRLVPTTTAIL